MLFSVSFSDTRELRLGLWKEEAISISRNSRMHLSTKPVARCLYTDEKLDVCFVVYKTLELIKPQSPILDQFGSPAV